jgi:hypothetical protein
MSDGKLLLCECVCLTMCEGLWLFVWWNEVEVAGSGGGGGGKWSMNSTCMTF